MKLGNLMAELLNFAGIRQFNNDLRQRLGALREAITKLQAERARVQHAPAAKEDVFAMLERWIERSADDFVPTLRATLNPFVTSPKMLRDADADRLMRLAGAGVAHGQGLDPKHLDGLLCALFGDQLRAALREALTVMAWPANAMSASARASELTRLDRELAQLIDDEAELVRQAQAAGLQLKD